MIVNFYIELPNYEGLYAVSRDGEILSLEKKSNKWGGTKKPKVLSQYNDIKGYKCVRLSKNGKTKLHRIHRLVACTYIKNDKNNPQVNHKNGIKFDNSVENLEWCNNSENQIHRRRILKQKK